MDWRDQVGLSTHTVSPDSLVVANSPTNSPSHDTVAGPPSLRLATPPRPEIAVGRAPRQESTAESRCWHATTVPPGRHLLGQPRPTNGRPARARPSRSPGLQPASDKVARTRSQHRT